MKKENFTVKDKTEVALGLCGIAISIVALVVSWNTASITNQTSRQLLEYQLEQERLPRIVALNYRLPIEFARMDTYTVERRIDFSSVSKSLYPIRIPIYNVGVGFAQNCTIKWDRKSINDACISMKNELSKCCNVHEYDISNVAQESGYHAAKQDYIFVTREDNYDIIEYKAYYSAKNIWDMEQNLKDSLMCEDVQAPYLIPILDQAEPSYIALSNGLSVLLLEMANQGIEEPVSFKFEVSYQDLTGRNYNEIIQVTFRLDKRENVEDELAFQVSFETI